MKRYTLYIILFFCTLITACILTACGTQKKTAPAPEPVVETPQLHQWHTCLIRNAQATARMNGNTYSVNITTQVVRDSMLVISVTPFLGIEIMRLEATPFEIIGIDKLNGQYVRTTYTELNRQLTPAINWDVLQQLCSDEIPGEEHRARLLYNFGNDIIELTVVYPANRQLDTPIRIAALPLNRYTQVDVSKWL